MAKTPPGVPGAASPTTPGAGKPAEHAARAPAPAPRGGLAPRELAYGGIFGAAALLLPTVFHMLQLGRVFMPMYLPLVALAFLVRPRVAVTTALLVPLLSAAVTGMPPLFPPVAPVMAAELALMGGIISVLISRFPNAHPLLILAPVLAVGRVVNVGLTYGFALLLDLPAAALAGLSFLAGWPGLILMSVVVPPLVRTIRGRRIPYASF
jgi:hypothetical protein